MSVVQSAVFSLYQHHFITLSIHQVFHALDQNIEGKPRLLTVI
jgi:hypothetical protein